MFIQVLTLTLCIINDIHNLYRWSGQILINALPRGITQDTGMDGFRRRRRRIRHKVNVRGGNYRYWQGKERPKNKTMKIGKNIRTRNTGISLLGQASIKLGLNGDRIRNRPFHVVSVSEEDSRSRISLCVLHYFLTRTVGS